MDAGKASQSYAMGIDIGTTSIKIAIIDATGEVVENVTTPSQASVASDVGDLGSEQCPQAIWSALQAGMRQLSTQNQVKVQCIGISGQMHGVMLWQHEQAWEWVDMQARNIKLDNVSNLYTWQDRRCTLEFLSALPKPNPSSKVSTGYGCATLFWLLKNKPQYLEERRFDCVGTVMDFVVAAICDLKRPVTSNQLAASMGYYNIHSGKWDLDILKESGFPVSMLPEVKNAGTMAGHLHQGLHHVPAGTPVLVAMGDMQCAVFSAVQQSTDAMMNISTSIQISTVVEDISQAQSFADCCPALDVVPYFNSKFLAVVAGLNGGNVIDCLVSTLKHWLKDLDLDESIPDKILLEKILSLGKASSPSGSLQIKPTVYGERHDPQMLAQVLGISPCNASLGAIFRAVSEGIVDNIFHLMSPELLAKHGVSRVIVSGSVLSQNSLVHKRLEDTLGEHMELVHGNASDSAFGAAKVALVAVGDSE